MYEGDELELKPDGTFTSTGAAAIEDGSIWINLANGRLNLKRDQVAGTEEAMTHDYIMRFKSNNRAIVEDDDRVQDHVLKRTDAEPSPAVKDVEKDWKHYEESHNTKITD